MMLMVAMAMLVQLPPVGSVHLNRPAAGTSIRPNSPIVITAGTTVSGDGVYDVGIEIYDDQGVMITGTTIVSKPKTGSVGHTFPAPQGGWPKSRLTIIVTNAVTGGGAITTINVIDKGGGQIVPPAGVQPPNRAPKKVDAKMNGKAIKGAQFAPGETVMVTGTCELEGATANGDQTVSFEILEFDVDIVVTMCGGYALQIGMSTTYSFSYTLTLPTDPGSYRVRFGSSLSDDEDLGIITIVAP